MNDIYYGAAGLVVGLALGILMAKLFAVKPAAVPAVPEPKKETKPVKPSGAPLWMLAQLQADARFIDFFLENIQGAPDANVLAALRDIHPKVKASLEKHLAFAPVLAANEGETTTVAAGFDPSAVRVFGNVAGEPPYTGEVQHPGWRVKEIKLPAPPKGADEFVIQPAEVVVT